MNINNVNNLSVKEITVALASTGKEIAKFNSLTEFSKYIESIEGLNVYIDTDLTETLTLEEFTSKDISEFYINKEALFLAIHNVLLDTSCNDIQIFTSYNDAKEYLIEVMEDISEVTKEDIIEFKDNGYWLGIDHEVLIKEKEISK